MADKISKYDFRFIPCGFGAYEVTYTSPKKNARYHTVVTEMPLIDAILYSDSPKIKDLKRLKQICKNG